VETSLAQTKQDIKFYESRRNALKNNKNSSKANIDKVEADIAALSEKVSHIVELTELTANDYYENVQFANAYNILIPATKTVGSGIMDAIHSSVRPIFVLEAFIFLLYLAIAFIAALRSDNGKKPAAETADDEDGDDEEEAGLEDIVEAIEEEAEKADEKSSGSEKQDNSRRKNKKR
jgi:hypothetical protein